MLAFVGGTGLYGLEALESPEDLDADTPFGKASAPPRKGRIGGREVLFLPRHGKGHALLPSEINYRANVFALKRAGARQVVSVSAVGSLREEVAPGHFAVPAQYVDMTKGARKATFFGEGVVAHVSTAAPSCPTLGAALLDAVRACGGTAHGGATYACVEGPRLGTRAESVFLREAAKADVVGMTNVPEAFLAREAQLCFATLAVCTDYDCWLDDPARHASVEQIIAQYRTSIDLVQHAVGRLAQDPPPVDSAHREILAGSILTRPKDPTPAQREILEVLLA